MGVLVCIPLVSWSIWWIALGWLPQGDEGIIAMKVHDVFSANPPLLGMRSTSDISAPGVWAHHPGPMEFYLLAIPYAVSGWHPAGLLIGCLLLAILVVALTIWQAWTAAGTRGVWLAGVSILGAEVIVGPPIVLPWNPWPPVLATAALMVLSWRVLRGRLSALPWLAVIASYVLQSNLALIPMVAPLLLLLSGVGLVRWREERGALWPLPGTGGPARHTVWWKRPGVRATALTLLCWAPPILEIGLISPNNPSQVGKLVVHSLASPVAMVGAVVLLAAIGCASWKLGQRRSIPNVVAVRWISGALWVGVVAAFIAGGAGRSVYLLLAVGGLCFAIAAWVYPRLPERAMPPAVTCATGAAVIVLALLLPYAERQSVPYVRTETDTANAKSAVSQSLAALRSHGVRGAAVVVRADGFYSVVSYQTAVAAALYAEGYRPYYDSAWPNREDDSFRRVKHAPRSAVTLTLTDGDPVTVGFHPSG